MSIVWEYGIFISIVQTKISLSPNSCLYKWVLTKKGNTKYKYTHREKLSSSSVINKSFAYQEVFISKRWSASLHTSTVVRSDSINLIGLTLNLNKEFQVYLIKHISREAYVPLVRYMLSYAHFVRYKFILLSISRKTKPSSKPSLVLPYYKWAASHLRWLA